MDKRQEVTQILLQNDKNIVWLKKKLEVNGFPSVDLYYLLSEKSKTFDSDIYDTIRSIFRNEGFISSESERCERFADQLIQVNGIIAHSTYLLNSNATEFIKDNLLDYREKKKLLEITEKIKNEFNSEMERIEKIIER